MTTVTALPCAGVAAAVTDNAEGVAGIAWGARIMPVKVLDSSGWGYCKRRGRWDPVGSRSWSANHRARPGWPTIPARRWKKRSTTPTSVGCSSWPLRAMTISRAIGLFTRQPTHMSWPWLPPTTWMSVHVTRTPAPTLISQRRAAIRRIPVMPTLATGSRAPCGMAAAPTALEPAPRWPVAHVAGLAALVWSRHLSWTNDQVEQVIESTALDRGSPGPR